MFIFLAGDEYGRRWRRSGRCTGFAGRPQFWRQDAAYANLSPDVA
jgi:hypothetical protein